MTKNSQRVGVGILGYAMLLLIPSLDTVLKFSGPLGVILDLIIGTAVVFCLYKFVLPVFYDRVSDRTAVYLSIFLFVVLIAIAFYMYPIANSGRFGGGSDADDALLLAGRELLSGRYPYYPRTYLGNPIAPLPGAVLFALPFTALNILPLQNVFWLIILFLVVAKIEKSTASALALVGTLLVLNITVLQNIATGCDYVSNSIYVAVLMWLLIRKVLDAQASEWQRILVAVLLGISLSSRSVFLLLMPLLFLMIAQNTNWKLALKYLSIAGVAFLLVTIPFYIYDPVGFTPLGQRHKVMDLETFLPFAGIIIPGSSLLLASMLGLRKLGSDGRTFFLYCAIVQMYTLLVTCVLYSLKLGRLDLFIGQSGYGMFGLFFAGIAAWMTYFGKSAIQKRQVFPNG